MKAMKDHVSVVSTEPLFRVLSKVAQHRATEVITLSLRVAYDMHGAVVITLDLLIKHTFFAANCCFLRSNCNINNSRLSILKQKMIQICLLFHIFLLFLIIKS